MAESPDRWRLKEALERQVERMERAERSRPTLLAHTSLMGMVGLLFVVPVVLGAYLGHWLDRVLLGGALRWTVGLIVLGVVVGAVNVYLYVRE